MGHEPFESRAGLDGTDHFEALSVALDLERLARPQHPVQQAVEGSCAIALQDLASHVEYNTILRNEVSLRSKNGSAAVRIRQGTTHVRFQPHPARVGLPHDHGSIDSREVVMSEQKKIGVGLVGCGSRLSGVVHGAIRGQDSIEVVALCDVSEDALTGAKELLKCPDATVYKTSDELAADPKVDWVCVGSWNACHREHIMSALKADKHVFTEKPLTTTIDDCVALKEAIDKHTKLFSMGFVLRYAPFYKRIRQLIDEGTIGKLVSFEFNETLGPDHGGFIMMDWRRKREWAGTHLLEKCCHDFDLCNYITGSVPIKAASFGGIDFFKPENKHHQERIGPHENGIPAYEGWRNYGPYVREHKDINPFDSDKDVVDNQVAILQYANGVRASFHTNLNCAITERRMYLNGTEGSIRGNVLEGRIEYKRIDGSKAILCEKTAGGGHGGADGTMTGALRDSMLNGTKPLVGLEDGIKSSVACFGVDEALDTGTVCDLSEMWKRVGIEPK
jgi:predicted dehydrogenase